MSRDEISITVTIKVSRAAWDAEYGCGDSPQAVRDDFGSWLRSTLQGSPCPPASIKFASHTRNAGSLQW
jgi:hypothetical protein